MNYYDDACSLYDGGWRKGDAELIEKYFEITAEEAEEICKELGKLEEEEHERESET